LFFLLNFFYLSLNPTYQSIRSVRAQFLVQSSAGMDVFQSGLERMGCFIVRTVLLVE